MEEIKINKTYFKLQGESNFPSKNPTPTRNRVSNKSGNPREMTYEDFQRMKLQEAYEKAQERLESRAEMLDDMKKLERISRQVENGELNGDPVRKEKAQKFVAHFKRRWYR